MPYVRGDTYIDRTPTEVLDVVSDERNEPHINPSMNRSDDRSTGSRRTSATRRVTAARSSMANGL